MPGRPVVQRIEKTLRHRILFRQWTAGMLLPSERALVMELGVSRMTVSRALEQLASEGLIEQRAGARSQVCRHVESRLPPSLIAVLYSARNTPAPPEAARLMQGVMDTLNALRMAFETVPFGELPAAVTSAVSIPDAAALARCQGRYGAFLLIEALDISAIRYLQGQGFPLAVANLEGDFPDVHATRVDHYQVACAAVELLAALGHRRIGLVSTLPDVVFYGRMLRGYRDTLQRLGLPDGDRFVSLCKSSSPVEAYVSARELFKRKPPPTAVVAGRDLHAEGIVQAARERGWRIGCELSVVGFDDASWPVETPFLTTFREPCQELGAEAARLLVRQMQEPGTPCQQTVIPVPLIVRTSAGPAPGGDATSCGTSLRLMKAP